MLFEALLQCGYGQCFWFPCTGQAIASAGVPLQRASEPACTNAGGEVAYPVPPDLGSQSLSWAQRPCAWSGLLV